MSDPHEERANVGGSGGRGAGAGARAGDGADEDDDEKGCRGVVQKQRRHGFGRDLRKAKQVVLFPFRKAKKKLYAKNSQRSSSSSDSGAAVPASGSGKRAGCYLCFTQPQTSESPVKYEISDPNNPRFTYECLKALIEKNDFYSKECNPHIDIFSSFSD